MTDKHMPRLWRIALAAALSLLAIACGDPESRAADTGGGTAASASLPAAAATAPAAAAAVSDRPRIVFLGDSLTAGLGLAPADIVSTRIQARLDRAGYNYEVVNAGVSGDTSAGGLSRLEWSLDGNVEILVLELGANDGLRGLPVDQMKRNLETIIRQAEARDIDVLLTGMEAPPNYGAPYNSEFRQVFRDLARAHDVRFLPFYLEGVAGIGRLNQADGIHPNADGSRIVEQTVWHALEPMLEKPVR
jgi:acyl-CoA thioesterase-1